MMGKYANKLLRVDLTNGKISTEALDEAFIRKTLGGKGLISHYLLKEVSAKIDAFSPLNELIFACGVLTGVPVSGMTRIICGGKSPLTGGYGQSEGGGPFGPELRKTGYMAIIFQGKAAKPVYLYINGPQAELRSAEHLWGLETGQTNDLIEAEIGHKAKMAIIGPAGENLVRYACIINDLRHANGRNGFGALMGSKKLKAIVVRGDQKVPVADRAAMSAIAKNFINTHMNDPLSVGLKKYGTSIGVTGFSAGGILPTKNFNSGSFEKAIDTGGEFMHENFKVQIHGCPGCAIKCKRTIEIKDFIDSRYGGPEYETLASFGPLILNGDIKFALKAHEVCNRLGIDTISSGSTIAFLTECAEAGLLKDSAYNEKLLAFGGDSGKVAIELLFEIAYRSTAVGDLLAEGSQRIAAQLPKEAQKFLTTCKGQEVAMHEARGKTGVGLGYALNEFGGDHMVIGHDPLFKVEGPPLQKMRQIGLSEPMELYGFSAKKIRDFSLLQFWWSMFNCAGICFFACAPRGAMPPLELLELLRAVTGWDFTIDELLYCGERAAMMGRLFNLREGIGAEADTLPERLTEPLGGGILKGREIDREELASAIKEYYSVCGLDEEGIPFLQTLEHLDLQEY